jgi:hypothetical protein
MFFRTLESPNTKKNLKSNYEYLSNFSGLSRQPEFRIRKVTHRVGCLSTNGFRLATEKNVWGTSKMAISDTCLVCLIADLSLYLSVRDNICLALYAGDSGDICQENRWVELCWIGLSLTELVTRTDLLLSFIPSLILLVATTWMFTCHTAFRHLP